MPRPAPRFHSFIGHKRQVDFLKRQLAGAKYRGEPFPHTCFIGPSGVGKTQLAEALATEYGTQMIEANGHDALTELVQKLRRLNACDFLFVDECHNLTPKAQELLYQVVDRSRVPNWEGTQTQSDSPTDTAYIELAPCTLVAATDQPGKLYNALQKRMEIRIQLGYYSLREMREIVRCLASDLGLLLNGHASGQIAKVSHGLPRTAKHHLQNLRRHFLEAESRQIRLTEVRQYLRDCGIDSKGLGKMERDYLACLHKHGPASLESLALHLGTDADHVRRQIEPALKRLGLFVVANGRQLTEAGHKWIATATKPSRNEPLQS